MAEAAGFDGVPPPMMFTQEQDTDEARSEAALGTTAQVQAEAPGEQPLTFQVWAITGKELVIKGLFSSSPLRALQEQIRSAWGIPISLQQLVSGTQVICCCDQPLEAAFAEALNPGLSEQIEVTCLRMPRSPLRQRRMDEGLVQACAAGAVEKVRESLAEEANPCVMVNGVSPMMVALARSTVARSQSQRNSRSSRALATVDEGAAATVLEELRRRGGKEPDMTCRRTPTFVASLELALSQRDFAEVIRQIAAGTEVNTKLYIEPGDHQLHALFVSSECTPLHMVCALHTHTLAVPTTSLLLAAGADLLAEDGEGETPLSRAQYFNAWRIDRLFREHANSLKISLQDTCGCSENFTFLGWNSSDSEDEDGYNDDRGRSQSKSSRGGSSNGSPKHSAASSHVGDGDLWDELLPMADFADPLQPMDLQCTARSSESFAASSTCAPSTCAQHSTPSGSRSSQDAARGILRLGRNGATEAWSEAMTKNATQGVNIEFGSQRTFANATLRRAPEILARQLERLLLSFWNSALSARMGCCHRLLLQGAKAVKRRFPSWTDVGLSCIL